jgi:hypothetical protein
MTDDQIGEIYALARESFFGGQRAFQVQALPFRMTPTNFARHRNNPNMSFWRMLKEGNDQFELTHLEPKVDFCEKRYVFNAEAPQNAMPADGIKVGTPWGAMQPLQQAQASLKFNPAGKCPAYQVPADIASELKARQRQDDQQIASLSTRVTAAPIRTGRDGGMHASFMAKLKPTEVREADGTIRYVVDENASKKLGSYVNPPLETYPDGNGSTGTAVAAASPAPRAAPTVTPAPKTAAASTYVVAAADSRAAPPPPPKLASESGMFSSLFSTGNDGRSNSDGVLGRMKTSVGRIFGTDDEPKPAAAAKAAPVPKPAARPAPPAVQAKAQPKPQPASQEPQQSANAAPAETPARQSAASGASLMSGAAPTIPAGSFDSRWGAVR